MTPFFSPGPNPYGAPKVFLAAVGELMTEVGGRGRRRRDHPRLHDRAVRQGGDDARDRARPGQGRARHAIDFEISGPLFVVTGRNEEELATASKGTQQQIAFYGSTPAYRGVLELHGWGDLQPELNTLSKQGEWVKMGELIDDDVLNDVRGRRRARRRRRRAEAALRGRRRPVLVLRAVPSRSRAVGRRDRRPQARVGRAPSPARRTAGSTPRSRRGPACGPKCPRPAITSSDPSGSRRAISAPNVGRDVGARLAARRRGPARATSGSATERAVRAAPSRRCAPRPRAGT